MLRTDNDVYLGGWRFMKKSMVKGALLLALGVTAYTGVSMTGQIVSAKQQMRVVKTTKLAGADYHVSGGYLYSSVRLTKRVHSAKNYQRTLFFSNRLVTVRKSNGHQANYQYIVSRNGRIHGWIWTGNLKKISNTSSTSKKGTTTPTNNGSTIDDQTNSSSADSASSASSTVTSPSSTSSASKKPANPTSSFSLTDYRASFMKYLNQERTNRRLQPYIEDSNLDALAQQRSTQLITNFSHFDAQGNAIADKSAIQFGVGNFGAECIAQNVWDVDSTSDSVAKNDIHEYIYDDAASNWGHRDILLNTGLKSIGMGATLHEHVDGFMATWTAADFGY